jgi:predicted lipid-binding transport protein (Tim44 family)
MTNNIDIIVFALVAAILLVRLWSVFGRRNDDDVQRPNPFTTPGPTAVNDEGDVPFTLARGGKTAETPVTPEAMPGLPQIAAPLSLLGALAQVKQLDPTFDEKELLRTARTIFTDTVTGFGKGDLAGVARYLAPSVLANFDAAVKARQAAGETLESRIVRLRDAETAAAETRDDRTLITVRFSSEQENILRDKNGAVLHGAPGKSEEIIDLWTFARDIKSANPDWLLVETRS